MPDRSEKLRRLNEEAGQYEIPYVSKSRLMKWEEQPEHYRLKYLEGIREPETAPMVRGSRIHEAIEGFYENIQQGNGLGISIDYLPDNRQLWADFIEPYISNFLCFEKRRLGRVNDESEYYPIGVEEEVWRDGTSEAEPEWMGIADAVYHASTIPGIEDDAGVVICDFKTGSVPAEQYRANGIYKELAYYSMVFDEKYTVAGVAAYYPRDDTLLVEPTGTKRMSDLQTEVSEAVEEMVTACAEYEGGTQFEVNPGPLCKWSVDDADESAFYGVCSQCDWGVPANNKETFEQMIAEGYSDTEIAEVLGTSTNAVNYWKFKMELQ